MYFYSIFLVFFFYKKENRRAVCTPDPQRFWFSVFVGLVLSLLGLAVLEVVHKGFENQTTKRDGNDDHDDGHPVTHQIVGCLSQELQDFAADPVQTLAEIVADETDQGHAGHRPQHVLGELPRKLTNIFHKASSCCFQCFL